MSEAVSNNLAQNDQEQTAQSVKKGPQVRRRLDHLTDLSDGHDQWDMIPRRLSRAYIDGKFPESKFRLLLCMMSHSGGFHIRREYLENRFSPKTVIKYLKELEVEGYIKPERVPCPTGGTMCIYNVRSLKDWDLYNKNDDTSPGKSSLGKDSLRKGHKDPNGEKKSKVTKPSGGAPSEPTKPKGNPPPLESANASADEIDEKAANQPPEKGTRVGKRKASRAQFKAPEKQRGKQSPSDYIDAIASKIKGSKRKPDGSIWVPKIEIANQAARKFITAHGHDAMEEVCRFIIEFGRIAICDDMFDDVLPYLIASKKFS